MVNTQRKTTTLSTCHCLTHCTSATNWKERGCPFLLLLSLLWHLLEIYSVVNFIFNMFHCTELLIFNKNEFLNHSTAILPLCPVTKRVQLYHSFKLHFHYHVLSNTVHKHSQVDWLSTWIKQQRNTNYFQNGHTDSVSHSYQQQSFFAVGSSPPSQNWSLLIFGTMFPE